MRLQAECVPAPACLSNIPQAEINRSSSLHITTYQEGARGGGSADKKSKGGRIEVKNEAGVGSDLLQRMARFHFCCEECLCIYISWRVCFYTIILYISDVALKLHKTEKLYSPLGSDSSANNNKNMFLQNISAASPPVCREHHRIHQPLAIVLKCMIITAISKMSRPLCLNSTQSRTLN